jgi:hypothetical protein
MSTDTATPTITELRNDASLWVQRNEWKPKHGIGTVPRDIVEAYTELWEAQYDSILELHQVKSLAQDLFRGLALAHSIKDSLAYTDSVHQWRKFASRYMDEEKLMNASVKFTRKNAKRDDVLKAMSKMLADMSDYHYRPAMTQFYSDGTTLYVTDGFRLAKDHTNLEAGYYTLSGSELIKTNMQERALPYQDVLDANMRSAENEQALFLSAIGMHIFTTELYLAQNKLVSRYGGIKALVTEVFHDLYSTQKDVLESVDSACDLSNPSVLFFDRAVNPQYLIDTLRYLVLRAPSDPKIQYVVKTGSGHNTALLFASQNQYVHALLMPKKYELENAHLIFRVA